MKNLTVPFVTSLYYFLGMGLLLDAAFYQMLRTSLLFFCVILRLIFLKKVIFYFIFFPVLTFVFLSIQSGMNVRVSALSSWEL